MLTMIAAAAASVMSDSVESHSWQPTRLLRPWDSPSKNTGVGCHFLLQCMKVKSECEVAQSCPTLRNPMDCSLPDSSIHGIFQARALEWVATAFSLTMITTHLLSQVFIMSHLFFLICHLIILNHSRHYWCTNVLMYLLLLSHEVVSNSFVIPWMEEPGVLQSLDFTSKNTGVVCHFLLQGISPIEPKSPALQVDSLPQSHLGSPLVYKSNLVLLITSFSCSKN